MYLPACHPLKHPDIPSPQPNSPNRFLSDHPLRLEERPDFLPKITLTEDSPPLPRRSLLARFRERRALAVTDITSTEWCEKQMEFVLEHGKPERTEAMKAGSDRHAQLEKEFLTEKKDLTVTLIRHRILPLYSLDPCSPYLFSTANWIIGQLALCLPEAMRTNIYHSLMKALTMEDVEDLSCYPVRASPSGAIAELIENSYASPDWLALLQVVVKRISTEDENESALLFQLLGTIVEAGQEKVLTHIPEIVSNIANTITKLLPPLPDQWPQVVERGFAALVAMAQAWESSAPDENKKREKRVWQSGQSAIAQTFSTVLTKLGCCPLNRSPAGIWIPLLLAISSCYLCYPDAIEQVLCKDDSNGYTIWASALAQVSSSSFTPCLSSESEIKLAVLTLATVIERLLALSMGGTKLLQEYYVSLESCIHLKEVQEDGNDDDGDGADLDDDDEEEEGADEDDEDSEDDDVREETEEEFLERYAAAAAGESIEIVAEGDIDDETQDMELGSVDEVDIQQVVLSLMQNHIALLQAQILPSGLIERIAETFPEYEQMFHVHRQA